MSDTDIHADPNTDANTAPNSKVKGQVFVIAAPSGTGKTTLCRRILAADDALELSVSHTTRAPREGEENGVHYHFVDAKEFRRLVEADAFLEHADYGGNAYGTSFVAIEGPQAAGRDVVLEIEVQGAEQVRERMKTACLIFLLPPSMEILEDRLRGRGTDSEDVIQRRMALADRELDAAKHFDYAVVNDDLDVAVSEVLEVISAVRRRAGSEIARRHGRERVLAQWEVSQGRG